MKKTCALFAALLLVGPPLHAAGSTDTTSQSPQTMESAPATERRPAGLIVKSVPPGSYLEKAGAKVGDIVVRINGVRVASVLDLIGAAESSKGKPISLTIFRDKQE